MTLGARPIRGLRWYVALLLCLASELNYLDRQTLSVLKVTIQQDLGFGEQDYANITSAFLISYTVMYAVSGRIVDVIGTRASFLYFVSAWSVANMLHGLAQTVAQFQVVRFLLGAAEPANFPAGVRAVSEWFPMRERALAVGIFNAGTALGSTIAPTVVWAVTALLGWRAAFVVTGALGFVWVLVWARFYRVPDAHPRLASAERALIRTGQADDKLDTPVPLARLLRLRQTWGCIAARAFTDPITYFLTFWVPSYLQQARGFSLADLGAYAWIPFAALAVGNIASGAIPRALMHGGWTLNRARKTTVFVASCGALVLFPLITRVTSPGAALACIAGVMFCHAAWGAIIFPAEVFPSRAVGTVSGLGGCLGGLAGVVTQQIIGRVVGTAGYAALFAACAVSYLVAFALVSALVGELGRVVSIDNAAIDGEPR
jgi:MFS transporter, ACS family, aldohexuronate transporter